MYNLPCAHFSDSVRSKKYNTSYSWRVIQNIPHRNIRKESMNFDPYQVTAQQRKAEIYNKKLSCQ